ncbi:2694_t:CDS:2 [Funneliformis mosseae]|uniref:2694_t:CDS:1 n=1 Tax=Funneliformis mosseae TaxID=27381 RepID=A0A9N9EIE5_FUNMO|nr:2694_t:CDS:2 [Funneliformis mosseae]
MQYANDGDLQNYLEKKFKYLTWDDKKKLAFQIAEGLNYLHNEYILHRDLHSKNIVIHDGNAKITDFGISKKMNAQNSKSDIYSYGVLMWEISSGVLPFESLMNKGDECLLRINIIAGAREDTIVGTPISYEELYKKCWDSTPKNRPKIQNVLEEFKKMGFGIDEVNLNHEDLDLKEAGVNVNNTSIEGNNNDSFNLMQTNELHDVLSDTYSSLSISKYSSTSL